MVALFQKLVWLRWDDLFWGYVKSQVYKNITKSISELKYEIVRVIGKIGAQLYQSVIKKFNKRVHVCRVRIGGHFSDIVFRKINATAHS